VVDEVALGRIFLRVLQFYPANIIPPLLHIYKCIILSVDNVSCWRLTQTQPHAVATKDNPSPQPVLTSTLVQHSLFSLWGCYCRGYNSLGSF
jgi:hypothetical protein